jgi:hypothetical protein
MYNILLLITTFLFIYLFIYRENLFEGVNVAVSRNKKMAKVMLEERNNSNCVFFFKKYLIL